MLKKLLTLSSLLVMTAGLSFAGEWTGFVSDAKCAKASAGHSACAKKCIEGGEAAVLVDEEGNVHQIANQEKVKPMAGEKVKVTGSMADGKITVESAEKVG